MAGADRSSTTGWTVGAQQSRRTGTPGITCSSPGCDHRDDLDKETVLVIGANCAPGGGFSAFAEDLALETTSNGGADDEALPTSGVTPPSDLYSRRPCNGGIASPHPAAAEGRRLLGGPGETSRQEVEVLDPAGWR